MVVRFPSMEPTRAWRTTGAVIGVGRMYSMCIDPVTHQTSGSLPSARPSDLYTAATAVHTEWQSIRVAMMPPLSTWRGPAMNAGFGSNVHTVSSPSQ